MNINDYRVIAQQEVEDIRSSSMIDYERYARDVVVKSLAHHIAKTCDIKREVVICSYDSSPRVRFSTEVYVFNHKQLMGLITTEISNAFIKAGKDYASKR